MFIPWFEFVERVPAYRPQRQETSSPEEVEGTSPQSPYRTPPDREDPI